MIEFVELVEKFEIKIQVKIRMTEKENEIPETVSRSKMRNAIESGES